MFLLAFGFPCEWYWRCSEDVERGESVVLSCPLHVVTAQELELGDDREHSG